MRISLLILASLTLTFTLCDKQSVAELYKSLNIVRHLQEAKLKPQGESGKKGPQDLPDYKGTPPVMLKDDWKPARDDFYKLEEARLDAQKKFHNSEFVRYVMQEDMNKKRKGIWSNKSTCIGDRVQQVKDLEENFQIATTENDNIINTNKAARNPANQRASVAGRKFWEAEGKSRTARDGELNSYKAHPIPTTNSKNTKKGKLVRRRNQAVVGPNATQKDCMSRLEKAWDAQFKALETSYNLNKKFHTVEFVEFELDGHKLADMQEIWEDQGLSHWEREAVWMSVNKQYNALRKAAATVINSANKARTNAQNVSKAADRTVAGVMRDAKCRKWDQIPC